MLLWYPGYKYAKQIIKLRFLINYIMMYFEWELKSMKIFEKKCVHIFRLIKSRMNFKTEKPTSLMVEIREIENDCQSNELQK